MKVSDLKSYHYAWLEAHPDRDREWLIRMVNEGFHVHHMDGNHYNDEPENLVLIEGGDHMRLHGMRGYIPINRWKPNFGRPPRSILSTKKRPKPKIAAPIPPKTKPPAEIP